MINALRNLRLECSPPIPAFEQIFYAITASQQTEQISQLLPTYQENHLHVCSTSKNIKGQQSQDALISVQAKAGGCHCLDASSNEYLIHRVPRDPT